MNSNYYGLPVHLDRVCRICLSEGANLSSIFCTDQDVEDFSGLSEKIQICGSIEIQEQDGLPSLICDVCMYKASVAHEFRQQCQTSDARLRSYYNKPARPNAVDSATQTEQQIQNTIPHKAASSEDSYFVKQELQSVGSQELSSTVEPFAQVQACMDENKLAEDVMEESKIFICDMGFDGGKEEEEERTETLVQNEHHSTFPDGEELQESVSLMAIEQKESQDESKNIDMLEEEYLDEGLLNHELEEPEKPFKRSYNRKAKFMPTKTYTDDEVEDDNYDPSSDSQDSEEVKFKCKVCSKRYTTLKGLKKHSLVHDKKYKCDICLKQFYKMENMEKHKKIHTAKPHACQLCHTSFSKPQSLVRHLRSHTEKVNDIIKQINTENPNSKKSPKKVQRNEENTDDETVPTQEPDEFENAPDLYKCHVCSQYCSSLRNLKRHTLIHGDKKYSCTICKKWFFRSDTLKKHAEKHGHGLLDNLVEDNKLFDSDDDPLADQSDSLGNINNDSVKKDGSDEDRTGEYKCQHCDKIMATKKGLRRHVSMHKPKAEPAMCEICKKVCASQARLALHQKTHNKPKEKVPREYLCHICSKVYPSNSSLTYHMRTHTGVKPHVCKICNSGFTTTTSLANHLRIHTGDKPFVCHVCSAAFAVSSAFRRHLTRHTGEANYLCKTCGKAFKRLGTLKEHTYTHSGEKPYVCKTCGAAYSHSGSLFAHQKRCRVQNGEMIVEDHHHPVAHHIHVTNVSSAVRSLTVIGQMF